MNEFVFLDMPMVLTKDREWHELMKQEMSKVHPGQVFLLPDDAILVAFPADRNRMLMWERPVIIGKEIKKVKGDFGI